MASSCRETGSLRGRQDVSRFALLSQEGVPLVLQEAMASGLPVISTRHTEEHHNLDKQTDRLVEIYRLLLEERFPFRNVQASRADENGAP